MDKKRIHTTTVQMVSPSMYMVFITFCADAFLRVGIVLLLILLHMVMKRKGKKWLKETVWWKTIQRVGDLFSGLIKPKGNVKIVCKSLFYVRIAGIYGQINFHGIWISKIFWRSISVFDWFYFLYLYIFKSTRTPKTYWLEIMDIHFHNF